MGVGRVGRRVRVAAIQMASVPFEVEQNLLKSELLVQQASRAGAEGIVPASVSMGGAFDPGEIPGFVASGRAVAQPGPITHWSGFYDWNPMPTKPYSGGCGFMAPIGYSRKSRKRFLF